MTIQALTTLNRDFRNFLKSTLSTKPTINYLLSE